jgi:hypothetical protein
MGKLKIAFEIARFVLFLVTSVKDLVLQAEEQMPESGRGSDKFAAVKQAVITAAKYADIGGDAIEKVDSFIDDKINETVKETVNAPK